MFKIKGRKLKGNCALIRLKPKNSKVSDWLFFKRKGPL
jgi:hypothetical protein